MCQIERVWGVHTLCNSFDVIHISPSYYQVTYYYKIYHGMASTVFFADIHHNIEDMVPAA